MMLHRSRYWKIFVRYLSGESSDSEQAEVRAYIATDEKKGRLFDELSHLWEAAGDPANELDTDRAWQKLEERIQQDEKIKPIVMARVPLDRKDVRRLRPVRYPYFSIAAAFAIVIVTSILLVQKTSPRVLPEEPDVFETRRGQRTVIRLVDGTQVQLNVDSRLSVSPDYASERREVHLEGEAFFQVAFDETTPFVLETDLGTIRVLGTEFNVSIYPESQQMQVVVAGGEVTMQSKQHRRGEAVLLRSHDLGLLSQKGEQVIRKEVDVSRYLAWMEGRLVFENAPFEEVARQLERWYDLEIELTSQVTSVDGLWASFTDEPLSEILNAISAALELDYVRDRRTIKFYPASR